MNQRKVYDVQEDGVIVYQVEPNFKELEEAKKDYISQNKGKLMYEITCNGNPSWLESDSYSIPYSQLDRVGGVLKPAESILKPRKEITKAQMGLLDVYSKNDLISPAMLKTVYNNKSKQIMHYFLFLTNMYTSGYKTSYHGNILALSRELYMYEAILHELYEQLDDAELEDVNRFFALAKCGEFTHEELKVLLENDMYNELLKRAKVTSKLVMKING